MSTLNNLKVAGRCFIAHLETIRDNNDHIFPICSCPDKKCSDGSFCLKLTGLYERELNKRDSVREILTTQIKT